MTDGKGRSGLEIAAIEPWFAAHVPQARRPLTAALIAGGHSNLTYRISDASGAHFAVRRPPQGTYPAGAHDMAREYRILAALAPTSIPAPPVLGLCEDTSVIGAPFYVMGWVEGAVIDTPESVERRLPRPEMRKLVAERLI